MTRRHETGITGGLRGPLAGVLALGLCAAGWLLFLDTGRGQASPALCAKTSQLAYSDGQYSGQKAMLYVANVDGTGRHKLVKGTHPVLSPSGRLVAVTSFSRSAGLGLYNVCGGLQGQYFSARDTVTSVAWSPDSSLVAVVVAADPNGAPFKEHLELIDVASGTVTLVATGLFDGSGGPSFSPAAPYQLAYAFTPKVNGDTDIWAFTPGHSSVRLTRGSSGEYPVWGPTGLIYVDSNRRGSFIARLAGGHTTDLLDASNAWPVAVSADGTHLAAENAACGVVWPESIDLSRRKLVHEFPSSFAPYGISPSGRAILISGSKPGGDCGGPRSVIETVPFIGGRRPTFIAYGTDPSWADSRASAAGAPP